MRIESIGTRIRGYVDGLVEPRRHIQRLRFQMLGRLVRGYVDDGPVLEASGSTHGAGRYGLVTYRTLARFDNVLATQP